MIQLPKDIACYAGRYPHCTASEQERFRKRVMAIWGTKVWDLFLIEGDRLEKYFAEKRGDKILSNPTKSDNSGDSK